VLEKNGDYVYFLRHKEYKHKIPGETSSSSTQVKKAGVQAPAVISNTYEIYCRHKADLVGKFKSEEEGIKNTEVVFDIEEIPFVLPKLQRKTVLHKFKISDDQTMVAFTVDIGNKE
jgi:hypothetical protein